MASTLTVAEALAADEERLEIGREMLLHEYRRLLAKRPDVAVPIGGVGPDSGLHLPPGAVENWRETLDPGDAALLGRIAARLGFDKKTVALHAIAISRLRRLEQKLETCGPGGAAGAEGRFKIAEKSLWAANRAVREAMSAAGGAATRYEAAQIKYRKALMFENERTILRSQFAEILPEESKDDARNG